MSNRLFYKLDWLPLEEHNDLSSDGVTWGTLTLGITDDKDPEGLLDNILWKNIKWTFCEFIRNLSKCWHHLLNESWPLFENSVNNWMEYQREIDKLSKYLGGANLITHLGQVYNF